MNRKPKATTAASSREPSLSYITEQLRPLAVPIGEVVLDPANARLHPDLNLEGIKASLRVYGQLKPIVVNRATTAVEAGNGTLMGAMALGWSHIAAVFVDHDPATAAGFSIADNRTAELAEWDKDALDSLLREVETTDDSLQEMLADLADDLDLYKDSGGGGGGEDESDEQDAELYEVAVTCRDEDDQKRLYNRFKKEGRKCRVLTV